MPRFVTHLEGAIDGARLPADQLASLHRDRPILVRYDLDAVRQAVTPTEIARRPETMWRYRELLPHWDEADIVTLGERMSPLLPTPRLGAHLGMADLWIKDESQLPTGSFKARGQAVAITMAKRLGVKRVALPTAGNAGGAAAAYAARAGLECYVFMPADTPEINRYECVQSGARTFLVNGLINDCGKIVREGKQPLGWFDLSTLKEPYRLEGKKTMGLELAEQFGWSLPDVILYPTGGGTGLIGMWKAFQELRTLGWLKDDRMPRLISVQASGCCPIVRAYEAGERFATPFPNAQTLASGLRVPVAVGDFLMLDAIRESRGCAIAADEASLLPWLRTSVSLEGIPICPEAAACVAVIPTLLERGLLQPREKTVIFNTGAMQKYVEALRCDIPQLDHMAPIPWDALSR